MSRHYYYLLPWILCRTKTWTTGETQKQNALNAGWQIWDSMSSPALLHQRCPPLTHCSSSSCSVDLWSQNCFWQNYFYSFFPLTIGLISNLKRKWICQLWLTLVVLSLVCMVEALDRNLKVIYLCPTSRDSDYFVLGYGLGITVF